MDTVNNTEPLRLQIFFLQPNGKYLLNVSTEKLIAPQYPNGKYCGNQIPDIEIENGCLNLISEIKDNHFMHKFKFRNGHFELINISNVISDGNSIINESEFNLLKGIKIEKTGGPYSGKPLKKTTKKIMIRPLPKIEDFKISDSRLN